MSLWKRQGNLIFYIRIPFGNKEEFSMICSFAFPINKTDDTYAGSSSVYNFYGALIVSLTVLTHRGRCFKFFL